MDVLPPVQEENTQPQTGTSAQAMLVAPPGSKLQATAAAALPKLAPVYSEEVEQSPGKSTITKSFTLQSNGGILT